MEFHSKMDALRNAALSHVVNSPAQVIEALTTRISDMVTLLASKVDDPMPVIKTTMAPKGDIFSFPDDKIHSLPMHQMSSLNRPIAVHHSNVSNMVKLPDAAPKPRRPTRWDQPPQLLKNLSNVTQQQQNLHQLIMSMGESQMKSIAATSSSKPAVSTTATSSSSSAAVLANGIGNFYEPNTSRFETSSSGKPSIITKVQPCLPLTTSNNKFGTSFTQWSSSTSQQHHHNQQQQQQQQHLHKFQQFFQPMSNGDWGMKHFNEYQQQWRMSKKNQQTFANQEKEDKKKSKKVENIDENELTKDLEKTLENMSIKVAEMEKEEKEAKEEKKKVEEEKEKENEDKKLGEIEGKEEEKLEKEEIKEEEEEKCPTSPQASSNSTVSIDSPVADVSLTGDMNLQSTSSSAEPTVGINMEPVSTSSCSG